MRCPRPKFKVSFYLYFCCFWINVTQINIENIKRKIQRIISDSCFQLKSWFNVDSRAPSIPLLNFPFNQHCVVQSSFLCRVFSFVHFSIHSRHPLKNLFIHNYTGWPKKTETVDKVAFSGLCSDQQLSFSPCWIEASFPHYNNTKIIKFGWDLRTFYFMSNFLWTVIFRIFWGTINDKLMANPENDSS